MPLHLPTRGAIPLSPAKGSLGPALATSNPPSAAKPAPRGRGAAPLLDNPKPQQLNGRHFGAVAQLGERCNRTAEVRSSILLGSTNQIKRLFFDPPWQLVGRTRPVRTSACSSGCTAFLQRVQSLLHLQECVAQSRSAHFRLWRPYEGVRVLAFGGASKPVQADGRLGSSASDRGLPEILWPQSNALQCVTVEDAKKGVERFIEHARQATTAGDHALVSR